MKDPAFLFYTGDFSTGTQFFTDEQLGKYMRLLMAQHQHGHLDENQVLFICKSYDCVVMKKFIKDDVGLYYNTRLELEINKRKSYSESRGKNKLGKSKTKKIIPKSYDFHMEEMDLVEILEESTKSGLSLGEAAKKLVESANARGGDDNVTVVLVKVS